MRIGCILLSLAGDVGFESCSNACLGRRHARGRMARAAIVCFLVGLVRARQHFYESWEALSMFFQLMISSKLANSGTSAMSYCMDCMEAALAADLINHSKF